GTAPGMWFEENSVAWMSMPGVPHEMEKLMVDFVLPELKRRFDLPVIYHKVIRTVGIGESWLADILKSWEENLPEHIKLAYLPSLGEVKLRLTAVGKDYDLMVNQVAEQIHNCLPLISSYIYGYDNETISEVVGRLLKNKNKTLALAESCSGGYISHLITSIAGSSAYFNGAIVPYHNAFKIAMLAVKESTLGRTGAVSEDTVIEMAKNVRKEFKADFGLSTSGIAGPAGGTIEKPVGTVWVACDYEGGTVTKKLQLSNERDINIYQTAIAALNILRNCILNGN